MTRTHEELDALASRRAMELREYETGLSGLGYPTPITRFTCFRCPEAATCRSAYDLYNTDGDCLEDK